MFKLLKIKFPFKIDIEGGEWMSGGFINWFQTGVLRNIHQIGLELHVRHMDADPRLDFFW